jgi:hypothetical protein
LVKKQRTAKATQAEAREFKAKALHYRKAMGLSYDASLWDAAVSNAVHAVILMTNAVTIRYAGEHFIGQDHNQAYGYLEETVDSEGASRAAKQMQAILRLKGLVEYEARSCTAKESIDTVKRVERFFSWAEKQIPVSK